MKKQSYHQGTEDPKKKYKKDKKVLDTSRPLILFRNYDYTDEGPNETSPGGGLYHGRMDKYKSVGDFVKKRRKENLKVRKKAFESLMRLISNEE